MKKTTLNYLIYGSVLLFLLISYIISVVYLNRVEIRAGNIVPVVNLWVLFGLVTIGIITGLLLMKTDPSTFYLLSKDKIATQKKGIYLLVAALVLIKACVYFLSPSYLQFMRVWPDSIKYLSDMYTVLQDPVRIFDRKSPIYTIWLLINYLLFNPIVPDMGGDTYFGVEIFYSNIVPPIILQNIIGIISAVICFNIFSKLNRLLAYGVTLLTFFNPTAIAIENAILRESLALFFVLSGFALFLKTAQQEGNIYKESIYSLLSGIIFVLAYQTRSELIVIYIILCPFLLMHTLSKSRKAWQPLFLFCLPVLLTILFTASTSYKNIVKNYGGNFGVAIFGLKSECYFYESQTFPYLIKNIQKRVIQCENERKSPCDDPAPSEFVLKSFIDEEIYKYIDKEGLRYTTDEVREQIRNNIQDQLFMDIIKNNTFLFIKSVFTNVGYNLIHNVHNTVPIMYDGNNYWISQNWNYYVSPQMLSLYEKDKPSYKYINYSFKIIELYTTRKILFPFFFIGAIILIFKISGEGLSVNYANKKLILLSILIIPTIYLLFLSIMANNVARFVYPILPFIFAVEVVGVISVYYWFRLRFKDGIIECVKKVRLAMTFWYIVVFVLSIALVATIWIAFKNYNYGQSNKVLTSFKAYAQWTMDDSNEVNKIEDLEGRNDAASFNTTIVEGYSGKARYFNGKDSYIKTGINFRGWKDITISLWVRPKKKNNKELSVILDNGHDANRNFTIQTADINDPNSEKWVFHCNGIDIPFSLSFNKWTRIIIVMDGKKGVIRAYINDTKVGEVITGNGFEFGEIPLSIGKLTLSDARYFKGSIDEVVIWDKVLNIN